MTTTATPADAITINEDLHTVVAALEPYTLSDAVQSLLKTLADERGIDIATISEIQLHHDGRFRVFTKTREFTKFDVEPFVAKEV